MVDVKFSLGKRDFAWIGLIVILVGVGFVYGYGGGNPSAMGHSAGEILVDNVFCRQVTGHNCGSVDNAYCMQITGHNCGYDNAAAASPTPTPTPTPTPVVIPIHHQACNGKELWWFSSDNQPTLRIDSCAQGMCYKNGANDAKCSTCDGTWDRANAWPANWLLAKYRDGDVCGEWSCVPSYSTVYDMALVGTTFTNPYVADGYFYHRGDYVGVIPSVADSRYKLCRQPL